MDIQEPIEAWIERMTSYVTVEEIIKDFELVKKNRSHEFVFERFYFCHFLINELKVSPSKVGRLLNKAHSTALHGAEMHQTLINDKKYIEATKTISEALLYVNRFKIKEELKNV